MQYRVRPTDPKHVERPTDSPGCSVGRSASTCQSGHPVRRRTREVHQEEEGALDGCSQEDWRPTGCRIRRCSSPRAAAATTAAAAAAAAGRAASGDQGHRARRSSTPNSMNNPPKGTVTYCQGKDTTGSAQGARSRTSTPSTARQGYKAKLTEFPASADEQRTQFIQRQQAKSDDCDVFSSDVIWTAEFASQKWLYDLTPVHRQAQKSKYIAAPLETVHYGGKYWGVPETSDAAFIYYRDDKGAARRRRPGSRSTPTPRPAGRHRLPGRAVRGPDLRLPRAGLRGRRPGALSPDGKKSTINSPQNVKALQLMVDGIKNGVGAQGRHDLHGAGDRPGRGPAASTAYMRNWTYAYAADNKGPSKVAGKYKVAPLPTFEGGGKAGILGGHNSVISVYTKNPGLALKLVGLLRVARVPEEAPARVLAGRRSSRAPTARRTSRRRSRTRRSSCRRSARPRRVRSRRSIRRSRRRSTRTSTTRSPVARARRTP